MTSNSLLFRQVNKNWVVENIPTSQVFKPMPKDAGLLSSYDSDSFSPEGSYQHFTAQGYNSCGVLGVVQQDYINEDLECTLDNNQFEGHVSTDYNSCGKKEIESKSKKLKSIAWAKGWLYRPTPVENSGEELANIPI